MVLDSDWPPLWERETTPVLNADTREEAMNSCPLNQRKAESLSNLLVFRRTILQAAQSLLTGKEDLVENVSLNVIEDNYRVKLCLANSSFERGSALMFESNGSYLNAGIR